MKIWRVFEMCFAWSGVLFADESLYAQHSNNLWQVYQQTLPKAKYVDLTHTITPVIPVWKRFGPSRFAQTVNPENGQPYDYAKDGFVATAYQLSTEPAWNTAGSASPRESRLSVH